LVVVILRGHWQVDVVVENFRPGVMEGWGLGPSDLSPSLIYTRISGYGQVRLCCLECICWYLIILRLFLLVLLRHMCTVTSIMPSVAHF
jgi:hypothetical protein